MSEYTFDKIEYGGNVYKVQDNVSGYITTETDPTVPSWAKASSKPTYTASEVGAAASTHAHGNITSGGDITAAAPTIANGDQLIINDNSTSKITNGPTFDGSTTTKALTPKGTWETFSQFSGSYNDLTNTPTIPTNYLLGVYPTTGSGNNNQWPQNFSTRLFFKAGTNMGIVLDNSTLTFNATVPTKVSDLTNDLGYITSYVLPTATTSSLGGIQVGTGLTASSNGSLSVNTDNSITTTTSVNYPTTSAVTEYVQAQEEILISSTAPTAANNYKLWIEI